MTNETAILIDGGFFIKRFRNIFKDYASDWVAPKQMAKKLHEACLQHVGAKGPTIVNCTEFSSMIARL